MSGSAKKPQRAGPKVALTEEGGRRHREAHAVQIRKQQREESVLKRRQLVTSALPSSGSTMPAARVSKLQALRTVNVGQTTADFAPHYSTATSVPCAPAADYGQYKATRSPASAPGPNDAT